MKMIFILGLILPILISPTSQNTVPSTESKVRYVNFGENVKLVCPIRISNSESIEWRNKTGGVIGKGKELNIQNIREGQLGSYMCTNNIKSNESIIKKSFKTLVFVLISKDELPNEFNLDISIISKPLSFLFLKPFLMECTVKGVYKSVNYTWYKYNQIVSRNSTVFFDKFLKTDLGVYTCVAEGEMNNDEKFKLRKGVRQSFTVFKVENVELVEGEGIQVGLNLGIKEELHCYVDLKSSKQSKDVNWFFEGKQLTIKKMGNLNISRHDFSLDSVLLIEQLELSHEGTFMCKLDEIEKRVNIVVVEELKLLNIHPKLLRIVKGDAAEFNCQLRHNGKLTNTDIEWFFLTKDGKSIINLLESKWTRKDSKSANKVSYISVANVSISDNGFYTCRTRSGLRETGELVVLSNYSENRNIITINPEKLTIDQLREFNIECNVTDTVGNPLGEPKILINGGSVIDPKLWKIESLGFSKVKVTPTGGLGIKENGTRITCRYLGEEKTLIVKVREGCPPGNVMCHNKKCLPIRKWCDGVVDCEDKSDEIPSLCKKCEPTQLPCGPSNATIKAEQTFNVNWHCDGEKDCRNGYDELNCPEYKNCNTKKFTCKNKDYIPYSRVCDGRSDCIDQSDEDACFLPQIIKTNGYKHYVKEGNDLILKCNMFGHPLPAVVWRYNWSCLPPTDRMVVTKHARNCNIMETTLTIKNFKAEDVAIYHCEAVTQKTRAFSKPFYVTMDT